VFERFTDRARRVLVLAQEEARRLNHGFMGTEHILLGLLAEGHGIGARALASLDISLDEVRGTVEEIIGMAGTAPSGSPPFTPRAKKVLELALREALQLGHSYIGTEHLLLGLVREGDGVAATVLVNLGAGLGRVRQATLTLMGDEGESPEAPQIPLHVVTRAMTPGMGPGWEPPVWDRPSEGTVPALLAVDPVVVQNDVAVLVLSHLEVYPNGFTIPLLTRVNPRKAQEAFGMLRGAEHRRWPEVQVRFADGKRALVEPFGPLMHKDEQGVPTEPIVSVTGRGGGPGADRAWAWVFPLPPVGPLEILVSHAAFGLDEERVTVDGTSVRAAAEQARVIWG